MTLHDGEKPWVLGELIEATQNRLCEQGYSEESQHKHLRCWRRFERFCTEQAWTGFSVDAVSAFAQSLALPEHQPNRTQQFLLRSLRMLTDMALHGCIQRRMRREGTQQVPEAYGVIFEAFKTYCRQTLHLRRTSMRHQFGHVAAFFRFAHAQGRPSPACFSHECFTDFFKSRAHHQSRTLAGCSYSLRSLCRFACLQGLISASVIGDVPRIRIYRDSTIPSVWKAEDVEKLLAGVDRSSPAGKRDYAILLLTTRLGLRVGDIRGLTLEHLNWERSTIELMQAKTGQALSLPLSEECGQALIDWLRHRPPCHCREVFVRCCAPFEPFGQNDNLHYIISTWRRRAKVVLPAKAKGGLHSLRHTVASRMLEAGVALETIASTLGHRNLDNTRIYLKIDIEALRSVALDPQEVRVHE